MGWGRPGPYDKGMNMGMGSYGKGMAWKGMYGKSMMGWGAAQSMYGKGMDWGGVMSMSGKGTDWGAPQDEKDEIVMQVKAIQRNDTGGRDHWERYCDAARVGSRDPKLHTKESLQNFVEAYNSGEPVEERARRAASSCRVLRLRGVPFQCDISHVVDFVKGYHIDRKSITLGRKSDGKPTGEAFVIFPNHQIAERALDELQKHEIQGRYIELFRSSQEEWDHMASISPMGAAGSGDLEKDELVARVKQIQRTSPDAKEMWYTYCDQLGTGNRDPSRHTKDSLGNFLTAHERGEAPEVPASLAVGNSPVLRLRGVPFQSDISDVIKFLADYGVEAPNITLVRNPDGKKTGEVYVIFKSPDEAERALAERQHKEIDGRYIEVFRSNFEEQAAATNKAPAGAAVAATANSDGGNWFGGWGGGGSGGEWGCGGGCGGGMQGFLVSTGDPAKDALIMKVKEIQRSGKDGRSVWEKYCDLIRTGNRDPKLHTPSSLKNFLEAFEAGEGAEGGAARADTGSCPVLRLRGVPFQSDILDVIEFLSEYNIDKTRVAMGRGADGRPTGEAYVEFPSLEAAERALNEKQKQEIRGRWIELFRSSYEERAQSTAAAPAGVPQSGDRAKDELVARVKQIQRGRDDGKDMWEKYCTEMRTGNRDPARHTLESIQNFLEAYEKGETPVAKAGLGGCVLRLRGVPFQCDVNEVAAFLADYNVPPSQISLGRDANGRMAGEAYAVFPSAELAERALDERQKKEIQGRYIELFRSSTEEKAQSSIVPEHALGGVDEKEHLVLQVKAIQRSGESGRDVWERYCETMRTGNRDPQRHTAQSLRDFLQAYKNGEAPEALAARLGGSRVVRLRGVPFQATAADVAQFLAAYKVDESQVTLVRGPDGKMTGDCFVIFATEAFATSAMNDMQKQEIGGRYIELFRSSDEELTEHVKRQHGAGWGSGGGSGGGGATRGRLSQDAPTLRLRGLPFSCGVNDVAQWLAEYYVESTEIVLSKSPDGKPTGEAYLACTTPELAQFILKEKHNQALGNRTIEIFESSYKDWLQASGQSTSSASNWSGQADAAWGKGAWQGGMCGKGDSYSFGGSAGSMADSWGQGGFGCGAWGNSGGGCGDSSASWKGSDAYGCGYGKGCGWGDPYGKGWGGGGSGGCWGSSDGYGAKGSASSWGEAGKGCQGWGQSRGGCGKGGGWDAYGSTDASFSKGYGKGDGYGYMDASSYGTCDGGRYDYGSKGDAYGKSMGCKGGGGGGGGGGSYGAWGGNSASPVRPGPYGMQRGTWSGGQDSWGNQGCGWGKGKC